MCPVVAYCTVADTVASLEKGNEDEHTKCTTPSSVILVTPHIEIDFRFGQHLAKEIRINPASVIREPHLPKELVYQTQSQFPSTERSSKTLFQVLNWSLINLYREHLLFCLSTIELLLTSNQRYHPENAGRMQCWMVKIPIAQLVECGRLGITYILSSRRLQAPSTMYPTAESSARDPAKLSLTRHANACLIPSRHFRLTMLALPMNDSTELFSMCASSSSSHHREASLKEIFSCPPCELLLKSGWVVGFKFRINFQRNSSARHGVGPSNWT